MLQEEYLSFLNTIVFLMNQAEQKPNKTLKAELNPCYTRDITNPKGRKIVGPRKWGYFVEEERLTRTGGE